MIGLKELLIIILLLYLVEFIFMLVVKFDADEKMISRYQEKIISILLLLFSIFFIIYTITNKIMFEFTFPFVGLAILNLLFIFKRGKRV